MSEIASLAARIFKAAARKDRFVVAVAGPPGAGKSTLAAELAGLLSEASAVVVPMDGFHFDDIVLNQRGLRQRKGAPDTFDAAGFRVLLERIRRGEPDIAIPIFDRDMELSRAAAATIPSATRFIIVEGNYLLLDEDPWRALSPLFDLSVFLDVPRFELERRLLKRWHDHGKSDAEARAWVASNDMPNVDRVIAGSRKADIVLRD